MLGKIPAARLALIEKIVAHALKSVPRARRALTPGIPARVSSAVSPKKICARIGPRTWPPRRSRTWNSAAAARATACWSTSRRRSNADAPTAAHRALLRVVVAGHALPGRFDRHRVQPDEHRRAPHRAPGAGRAARCARHAARRSAVDRRAVAARILADDRDRPAARRRAGARARTPRARVARRRAHGGHAIFRRMLERSPRGGQRTRARAAADAEVARQRGARAARLDARRTFRVPRLSLLPPQARPLARRAGARRRQRARHPARPRQRPRKPPPPIVLTGHLRRQARAPELLVLTKANTPSTVHRGSYLDYVGVKTFDAAGQVSRRASLPRPVDVERLSQAARGDSAAAAQARRGDRALRPAAAKPRRQVGGQRHRNLSARRAVPDADGRAHPHRARHRQSLRAPARAPVRRVATASSASIPASSTCRATATTPKCANASSASCAQRFGGTHVETQVQISDSMLARLHMLVRTPQGAPAVDNIPAIEAEIAAAAATWEDRLQQALIARGVERSAVELATRYATRVSAGLSRRRRARAGARRHRRPRSARRRSRGTAAQPARAARRPARPAVTAHPAGRRPDLASPTSCRCSRTSGCACSPSIPIR